MNFKLYLEYFLENGIFWDFLKYFCIFDFCRCIYGKKSFFIFFLFISLRFDFVFLLFNKKFINFVMLLVLVIIYVVLYNLVYCLKYIGRCIVIIIYVLIFVRICKKKKINEEYLFVL